MSGRCFVGSHCLLDGSWNLSPRNRDQVCRRPAPRRTYRALNLTVARGEEEEKGQDWALRVVRRGDFGELERSWSKLRSEKTQLAVLEVIARRGWREGIDFVVRDMIGRKRNLKVQTMKLVMLGYQGDTDGVLKLLANCGRSAPVEKETYNALLEIVNGRARAVRVLEELEARYGVQRTSTYAVVLRKCADEGDLPGASAILAELFQNGLQADINVYKSLLRTVSKKEGSKEKSVRGSLRLLSENRLLTPELLQGIARAHLIAEEYKLVKLIVSESNPSPALYAVLIQCFGRMKDLAGAENVFDSSLEAGVQPDIEMFNSLLDVYQYNANIDMVKRLYGRLTKSSVTPNAKTFHTLIETFRAGKDMRGCEKAVAEMEAHGLTPRSGIFNTLLKAYAETEDLQGFESCMKQMARARIRPNQKTHGIVIDAYSKLGLPQKGEKWFKRMVEHGIRPDAVICTSLMQLCIRDNRLRDAAKVLLKTMPELNVEPDQVAYKVLIRALVNKGHMEHAQLLAEDAKSRGFFVFVPRRNASVEAEVDEYRLPFQ